MKKILIILFLGFIFLLSACNSCPINCNDWNVCTQDYCSKETEFQCINEIKEVCIGNGICEYGEFGSFDCPDCEDNNRKTIDLYNYTTKDCIHETIDCTDECFSDTCKNSKFHTCILVSQGCNYLGEGEIIEGQCGVECFSNSDCYEGQKCISYECVKTSATESEAFIMSKEIVKLYLISPSSAKFPWFDYRVISLGQNNFKVSSHVDSKNAFGTEIRSYWTISLTYRSGEWTSLRNWDVTYLDIGGLQII